MRRGQPVLEIAPEPFCIPLALESDHKVIGVAHDDRLATGDPGAPLPLEPEIKDEVQVDVRQNRRDARVPWCSPQGVLPFAVVHDAGAKPFGYPPDDPPVPDPVLHELQKSASIQLVERTHDYSVPIMWPK